MIENNYILKKYVSIALIVYLNFFFFGGGRSSILDLLVF